MHLLCSDGGQRPCPNIGWILSTVGQVAKSYPSNARTHPRSEQASWGWAQVVTQCQGEYRLVHTFCISRGGWLQFVAPRTCWVSRNCYCIMVHVKLSIKLQTSWPTSSVVYHEYTAKQNSYIFIWTEIQEETLKTHQCPVESPLLDGHLSLIVELLSFRTTSERHHIGGHPDGDQLIKVSDTVEYVAHSEFVYSLFSWQKLVLDFMFPASRLVKEARENPSEWHTAYTMSNRPF